MINKTPPKQLGKNGFKYRPKFAVIVMCTDEENQETVFNNLKKQGHKCKVVSV